MLQENNIYLGDAFELIKQVSDNSIDCIYTDIPYLHTTGGIDKSTELGKQAEKIKSGEIKVPQNKEEYEEMKK